MPRRRRKKISVYEIHTKKRREDKWNLYTEVKNFGDFLAFRSELERAGDRYIKIVLVETRTLIEGRL